MKVLAVGVLCDPHFRGRSFEKCAWHSYIEAAFNCPDNFRSISHTELELVRSLRKGIDIVRWNGENIFVHKYMTPHCYGRSFTAEVENYIEVLGSPFVPILVAVVQNNQENRGLLLSYVDGDNLADTTLTTSDKWKVTLGLFDALKDLEARSYFPRDLKPPNIIFRNQDLSVMLVDLREGWTKGYHLDRSNEKT
jgi:serine/threonine protein kinase